MSASTTAAVQVISLPPSSSSAACHGTKPAFKVKILQTAHEDMFGPLTTIPGSETVERHQAKVRRDGSFDSSESVIQRSHLRDWNLNTQDVRVQEISDVSTFALGMLDTSEYDNF